MKVILFIVAFIAISTLNFGQVALVENTLPKETSLDSERLSAKEKRELGRKQTKSVVKQLNAYLSEQLRYSNLMKENCIEGAALVQVNLSDSGAILSVEMVESPHPEVSALVLNAMKKMERLQLKNRAYFGVKKLRFPVNFSLR